MSVSFVFSGKAKAHRTVNDSIHLFNCIVATVVAVVLYGLAMHALAVRFNASVLKRDEAEAALREAAALEANAQRAEASAAIEQAIKQVEAEARLRQAAFDAVQNANAARSAATEERFGAIERDALRKAAAFQFGTGN